MVGLPLRALSRPIQVVSGRQETLQTILPRECREAFCFCFAQPVLPFNSRFVGHPETENCLPAAQEASRQGLIHAGPRIRSAH
jgi:hypothetical protein